jgi:glycosyltransferase involved in cell wall biosynthesis
MKFSVLMSVYNKEKAQYLDECLKSLFVQTLKPDEIVLVEDGLIGKDLVCTIEKWKKILPLKSVKLTTNSGLPKALNEGLKLCSHNIVARMDTDDICFDNRFEKQILFVKNNPALDVIGSQIVEYDETMRIKLGYRNVPLEHKNIIKFARFRTAFNHMTVMFKKDSVLSVGGYPEDLIKMQDFALWGKLLAKGFKTANIDEALVKVRTGENLFNRRTGLGYLMNEIKALRYVKQYGLINPFEFIIIMILKIVTRLMPLTVIKFLYKNVLRK